MLVHLTELPKLILLEYPEGLHVSHPLLAILLRHVVHCPILCIYWSAAWSTSRIVSLSFYNIQELSICILAKSAVLLLIQAILTSGRLLLTIRANCCFLPSKLSLLVQLRLLNADKFSLFSPLQVFKDVDSLDVRHASDIMDCQLRWLYHRLK